MRRAKPVIVVSTFDALHRLVDPSAAASPASVIAINNHRDRGWERSRDDRSELSLSGWAYLDGEVRTRVGEDGMYWLWETA